jgi:hypothetical protein
MWIENATDNTYVLYTPVSPEPELQHELEIIYIKLSVAEMTAM